MQLTQHANSSRISGLSSANLYPGLLSNVKAPEAMQETALCKICLQDLVGLNFVKIDDCNHSFCKTCMRQYIGAELLHGSYPLRQNIASAVHCTVPCKTLNTMASKSNLVQGSSKKAALIG